MTESSWSKSSRLTVLLTMLEGCGLSTWTKVCNQEPVASYVLAERGPWIIYARALLLHHAPTCDPAGQLGVFPSGIMSTVTRAERGEADVTLRCAATQLCELETCFRKRGLIPSRRGGRRDPREEGESQAGWRGCKRGLTKATTFHCV